MKKKVGTFKIWLLAIAAVVAFSVLPKVSSLATEAFAYILFRHAVMVKLESYIAVPHYRCRALLLHLVAYGGKWAEVLGFNLFASGQGTSVHPAPVKG